MSLFKVFRRSSREHRTALRAPAFRRRLGLEALEQRTMLSITATAIINPVANSTVGDSVQTSSLVSSAVSQQTLADLPVAAQKEISSAIAQDQNANQASPAASGVAASMTQAAELTASNGAANDELGYSVAVSQDTIVVGAPYATVGGHSDQGVAYVFTESGSSGANMTQVAELTASDSNEGDLFGSAVAISWDTVVVGAYGANAGQGAAYVFTEPNSGWTDMTQVAKLTASDGAARQEFGFSVSVNIDTVVVGAPDAGKNAGGAAYVFVEPGTGWATMTQTVELTTSDGASGDGLGTPVSVNGIYAVVGAPFATVDGNSRQGAAYVFAETGSNWTQVAELTASDGAAYDWFGQSVSISGNTVVVGAAQAKIGANNDQGAAYVFVEPASGWENMTQTAELTASDGSRYGYFGKWGIRFTQVILGP
jgi:hypothetical protein